MSHRARCAAVLLLVCGVLSACSGDRGASEPSSPATRTVGGTDSSSSPLLTVPRAVHKATVLRDGRVLITGGCSLAGCEGFERTQAAEVFDTVSGTFTTVGRMHSPRAGHSATLLRDGAVVVLGGYPGEGRGALSSAEVFEPATGAFRTVGDMALGRADHTATLMPDGRVLVAGGTSGDGRTLDTTVFFDPRSNRFEPGPRLPSGRSGHASVLTSEGLMLVGGSGDLESGLSSTDLLRGGRWVPGPDLLEPRTKHAAVAVPDGSVLVIGGSPDAEGRELLSSTEILDVAAGRSRHGPDLSEGQYKLDGAVASLPDGRVVIGGGRRVEVYDPDSGTISVLDGSPVPRRSFVTVSSLARSEVLIAGGYDSDITPTAAARVVRIT